MIYIERFLKYKKIFFIYFIVYFIFFINSSFSNQYNYKYQALDTIYTKKFQIIEFFSFYCHHCYTYENILMAKNNIKAYLPKNVKFIKYHISTLGGDMGIFLTKIWSLAMLLGIDEKIKFIIFNEIHKKNTILNKKIIKKIFISMANITEKKYKKMWNNILINKLTLQQEKLFYKCKLHSIPSTLVNGKYIINISKINFSTKEKFFIKYVKIINYLLKKYL